MEQRTIDQLEHDLRGHDAPHDGGVDIATIRAVGTRRRRARGLLASGGTVAAVAVLGLVLSTVTDGGDRAAEEPGPATQRPVTPKELSPLAQRVLAEVPGAVQVSAWQVVIPAPGARPAGMSQEVPADRIAAGPVDIGTRLYTGVTTYRKRQFPAWLYDGVEKIEKTELGDENGYPVGSTEMGIIVDGGPMDLACMKPLPDWGDADELGDGCNPSMLGEVGGSRTFEWGMGTDDFVQEGKPLELFSVDDYSDGTARTVWIGGTDGTDVASVELVGVDGTRVDATVAAGTLMPEETMFWGTVSGELALAVTRDADGNVLERHEVRPCGSPVDCEVR